MHSMAKNRGRYTLFLCELSAHNSPIIARKNQNIVNLSSHATLHVVSALRCKKSVESSGIQGEYEYLTFSQMTFRENSYLNRIFPLSYNEQVVLILSVTHVIDTCIHWNVSHRDNSNLFTGNTCRFNVCSINESCPK